MKHMIETLYAVPSSKRTHMCVIGGLSSHKGMEWSWGAVTNRQWERMIFSGVRDADEDAEYEWRASPNSTDQYLRDIGYGGYRGGYGYKTEKATLDAAVNLRRMRKLNG